MQDNLAKKEALDFLKNNYIMEVATCWENRPAVSILLYAVDEGFHFFFATHRDSVKAQNLLRNPNISLSVWKANERMIQAYGQAKEITDSNRQNEVIDALAEAAALDEAFWPPMLRIGGNGYAIFEVSPAWMRSLDLSRKTVAQESSPFEDIRFK